MIHRLIAFCLLVAALLSLVLISKWRPESNLVSGMIEADEIRLGSRVGGRVSRVLVIEGQNVEKGQLLLELEPYDLVERHQEQVELLAALEAAYQRALAGFRTEEIAQAKAKLDQLQARLDLLRAGPRPEEIDAAQARLEQALAEQRRRKQDFDRESKLAISNATSQQQLDAVRQALEVAEATITVREKELEVLKLGTREEELRQAAAQVEEAYQAWQLLLRGSRPEDIENAKASRDAAMAKLKAIEKQIDELQIVSPVAGTIEALDLQPGDIIAAGAPVMSLLDRENLWVRTYIPQTVAGLELGRQMTITPDSYPDEKLQASISFIARQAEFTPSNVQTPEERSKLVY
ncbi:MAG: efflux RND transporter periplasmic adaptor subunit, partial [bacterium]|nr:efflux RND transporter periplasmic adaptor subunit [bacterium]